MEVAELRILRLSLGVTRLDKIRNEYISGTKPGRMVQRHSERNDIGMVWAYVEEGCGLCRDKKDRWSRQV